MSGRVVAVAGSFVAVAGRVVGSCCRPLRAAGGPAALCALPHTHALTRRKEAAGPPAALRGRGVVYAAVHMLGDVLSVLFPSAGHSRRRLISRAVVALKGL